MFHFLVILLETQDSSWDCIHLYFCRVPQGWGGCWVKAERKKGEKNSRISPHSVPQGSLSPISLDREKQVFHWDLDDCSAATTATRPRVGEKKRERTKAINSPILSCSRRLLIFVFWPDQQDFQNFALPAHYTVKHWGCPWVNLVYRRGKTWDTYPMSGSPSFDSPLQSAGC